MANTLAAFENPEKRGCTTVGGQTVYVRLFDRVPKHDRATVRPSHGDAMPSGIGGDTAAVATKIGEVDAPGDLMAYRVEYTLFTAGAVA